jgi:hypothetical protein
VREPRAEQPSNAMVQAELDGLGVARLLAPGLLLVLAVVVGGLALALAARAGAPRGHVLIGGLVATDLGILIGILVAVAVAGSITDQLDIPITEISISVGGIVVAAVLGAVAVLLSVGMARATEAPRHPTAVGVALAGAGAALAVAAVLAPLGIVDAAEATLARAARLEVVDAQIAFQVPVGDEQIAQLGDIGGVAVAEPLPSAVVELARGPNGYATQIEAFERGSELARFETPGGEVQALPEDGLLVPGPLADILHAEPGDAIDVTLPGVGTFSMSMAARTSDALGNLVFTSIPGLREAMNAQPGDFAGGLFNVAATRFEPGADSVRIAREITKEPTVATYVDVAVDLDSFVGALPLLRVVSWTLLGIGAAIAVLAALVAALAIAPGARFRDLLFELVLPGIVGAGLGILIGAGAADRLVDALETPVVHLQEGLDASSVLVAVGVVVLVDLVVAGWTTWSARRHAATMDGHG